jgi:hypothetical protein
MCKYSGLLRTVLSIDRLVDMTSFADFNAELLDTLNKYAAIPN